MDEIKNATFIPNSILEKIYSTKLNGTQLSIALVVCRFTYGFQRDKHTLSAGFISKATGINLRNVKREIDNLATRKIILITANGNRTTNTIQINADSSEWVVVKSPLVVVSPPVVNTPLEQVVNSPLEVVVNTPPKKEKEIKKEKYIVIFNHWNQQKITIHRDITKEISEAADKALKKYTETEIVQAITRYSQIYHDADYYFSYNWTLANFLKQKNALPEFMDDGQKWIAYPNKQSNTHKDLMTLLGFEDCDVT